MRLKEPFFGLRRANNHVVMHLKFIVIMTIIGFTFDKNPTITPVKPVVHLEHEYDPIGFVWLYENSFQYIMGLNGKSVIQKESRGQMPYEFVNVFTGGGGAAKDTIKPISITYITLFYYLLVIHIYCVVSYFLNWLFIQKGWCVVLNEMIF